MGEPEGALAEDVVPEGAELCIATRRRRGRLEISVSDDGPGLTDEPLAGLGLQNVRARLAHLYGVEQAFSLDARPVVAPSRN